MIDNQARSLLVESTALKSAPPNHQGDSMSLSMTCKHCGTAISADDEEELVTGVQSHARTHGDEPELTPEHILGRLHRLQRKPPEQRPST